MRLFAVRRSGEGMVGGQVELGFGLGGVCSVVCLLYELVSWRDITLSYWLASTATCADVSSGEARGRCCGWTCSRHVLPSVSHGFHLCPKGYLK